MGCRGCTGSGDGGSVHARMSERGDKATRIGSGRRGSGNNWLATPVSGEILPRPLSLLPLPLSHRAGRVVPMHVRRSCNVAPSDESGTFFSPISHLPRLRSRTDWIWAGRSRGDGVWLRCAGLRGVPGVAGGKIGSGRLERHNSSAPRSQGAGYAVGKIYIKRARAFCGRNWVGRF